MSDPSEVEAYVVSLKVVELKDELKKRHLPYMGNKSVLAQRLREDMLKSLQQQEQQAEEEEEEAEPQQQEEMAMEPAQEEVLKEEKKRLTS